jgi:hypothetical protein
MRESAKLSKDIWVHVHLCPQCEQVVLAENIAHVAITTGVMTCTECEWSGPINLQIVLAVRGSQ